VTPTSKASRAAHDVNRSLLSLETDGKKKQHDDDAVFISNERKEVDNDQQDALKSRKKTNESLLHRESSAKLGSKHHYVDCNVSPVDTSPSSFATSPHDNQTHASSLTNIDNLRVYVSGYFGLSFCRVNFNDFERK